MPSAAVRRVDALYNVTIAVIAFLTVVDLFASQAILPSLAERFGATPAATGLAVNAATIGMAAASLLAALFGGRVRRRAGVVIALAGLSAPTILLAFAPDLSTFAALRVVQGLLMATAFSLTLAWLGERCSARAAGGAFAAYITGNVAANLFGRLLAAALVQTVGVAGNFFVFAAMNAAGGALALAALRTSGPPSPRPAAPLAAARRRLLAPPLALAFAVGFLILFSFIGVFTYVNFVLVAPPFSIERMSLGFVYLVFAPSVATTPFAGAAAAMFGPKRTLMAGLAVALVSLPLLLAHQLALVLAGMAVFAAGAFFAQAAATAHVSATAAADKGAASGLYLASYFSGGLVGAAALGAAFESGGWSAAVAGVAAALATALLLASRLPHRDHARTAFQDAPSLNETAMTTTGRNS